MYVNNIIIFLLYAPVMYFYLTYFGLKTKGEGLNKLHIQVNILLTLTFGACILAGFMAFINGKLTTPETREDFSRLLFFLLVFVIPISWKRHRFLKTKRFEELLFAVLVFLTIAIGISLFSSGLGKSAFPGGLLGATTVNLTMVSIISYYGLYRYYRYHSKSGLLLAISAWLISLASLAKWNFWVDVSIPVLVLFIFINTKFKTRASKTLVIPVIILIVVLLAPFATNYLDQFAAIQNYSSFDQFLNSRVLRSAGANVMEQSGAVFSIGGKGISDGARISMWLDLLSRTWQHPITGLGFGVRAFDYQGLFVEDHSIIVFMLARFGFLFGLLFIYLVIHLFKHLLKEMKNDSYPIQKYIVLALTVNFLFQGSIGMIWGQLPVTLLISFVLGVILNQNINNIITTNLIHEK